MFVAAHASTYFPAEPLLSPVVVFPTTSAGSAAETDPRSNPTPGPRLKQNSSYTCDGPSVENWRSRTGTCVGGADTCSAESADNSVLQAVNQLSL